MTRRSRTLLLATSTLLSAFVSSGCLVSSFHAIYDDSSVVFDERIVGAWDNRENGVSVTVARGEWRSYRVEYVDRTGPTHFTAFLTEIGGHRFLNLRPEDGLERPAFLVATNGIIELDPAANEVRVRELDYDEVAKRLSAGRLNTPASTDLKQNVVLTGDTAAIRKWLAASLQDEALFADWKTFTRK
jgi:hypothetical protein